MTNTLAVANKFMQHIEAIQFLDAFALLGSEGTYTVVGTTKASRTYKGKEDVYANLVPLLATFKEPPALKFKAPIIDGDRAVMLASGEGLGPTGPYKQPYYAFVTRVRGHEFAEIIEFADTVMLETAIFGRKLMPA